MKLVQILILSFLAISIVTGQVKSIYDIQYTTDVSGDSPLKGQVVTIEGTISGESGAFGSSYYVQDAHGPWSGILVYDPDRVNAYGDSVRITATVSEYYGMTELGSVTEYVKLDSGKTVEPIVVTSGEIATGGTNAEAYEGVLVTVENADIVNADLGNGEWSIDDGTGACRVDDAADYFFYPAKYESVKWVTGLLNYSFNDTKIEPRLAMDVKQGGEFTRLQYIQQVRVSDLLKTPLDGVSDKSYFDGDTFKIRGVVTMPTGLSYAGAGVKFILAEEEGGPWGAILSYNADSTLYPTLFEGDIVTMEGYIGEYTTTQSNMTEFWITSPIEIIDFGQPVPAPNFVKTGDLRLPLTAEQWGNVLVYVKDATVININPTPYELFQIDDGTGAILVDDDSDSLGGFPDPPQGTIADSIRGWVYHHFGSYADSNTYVLEPLYTSDIVWGAGPPSISKVSRDKGQPASSDAVTVSADIATNLTISEAALYYEVVTNGISTGYTKVVMTNTTGNTYQGVIPAQAEGSFVNYFMVGTDDQAQSTITPADTSVQNYCYPVIDGALSIKDVQYTPWPIGDSPFEGYTVTLTGVITVDTSAHNTYGAYSLQDAEGAWNGLFLFGVNQDLTRGDEVTVTGKITDYNADYLYKWGSNTMMLVSDITVNSSGNSINPASVTTGDLGNKADNVEAYEGTYVEISNATLISLNQYDCTFDDGSGPCLVDGDFMLTADQNQNDIFYINDTDKYLVAFGDTLRPGDRVDKIRGIFTYSFGSYKVSLRDYNDFGIVTGINPDFNVVPLTYKLDQNFPNPFNPETRIYFEIPQTNDVTIAIYNILGQKVTTLIREKFNAGQHIVNWNGRNDAGMPMPTGTYIYRIKAGKFTASKKMLLVR
ncbi:MAG: T9SS type A sorting domain-containing protein [Calditrichaeota bacterium]|nr:T9SS type A sorting domain-containing protein [Calditrichota bacterium]